MLRGWGPKRHYDQPFQAGPNLVSLRLTNQMYPRGFGAGSSYAHQPLLHQGSSKRDPEALGAGKRILGARMNPMHFISRGDREATLALALETRSHAQLCVYRLS